MSSNEIEDSKIFGCSVRGPGHVEENIPNQDSLSIEKNIDNCFAIAISDGLGSSIHSDKGSRIATEETCKNLKKHLESTNTVDEKTVNEFFRDSFNKARTAIREQANKVEESPSEFDATIVAAIGGPFGVAGAMVGDGGIVYEEDNEYNLLVDREMAVEDLAASHLTHSVVDDNWPCYRYDFSEYCDGVVLFSDGIEEFVWGGKDSVRPSFFQGAFKIARKVETPKDSERKLEELLTSDSFSDLSDDKTVAVVDFGKNNERKVDEDGVEDEREVDENGVEDEEDGDESNDDDDEGNEDSVDSDTHRRQ
jgi:serine/threonine protein phosphatase PrpC